MKNQGMTLLEVMMAMAILTIVMGTLFGMSLAIYDTQQVQEAKVRANDEARRALYEIMPQLRQAASNTINVENDSVISYRIATDLNGNGTAVDASGTIELSPLRTIEVDEKDRNGDGITNQLVLVNGNDVRVLANNVAPNRERPDANGVFGPAQDTNGNGRLDPGFWVRRRGAGLEVTVQTQVISRRGYPITAILTEYVDPRN